MRHSVARLWRSFAAFVFLAPLISTPLHAGSDTAVLVMAQDRSSEWNKTIKKAVKAAELPYPYRIFFGMGDSPAGQRELQEIINDLENEGANTIYVVPLLVSPYAPAARQWKYLLGVDVQPGFMSSPLFPVTKHSSIHFGEPLNDSATVVEILLDHAQEISSTPAKESVLIVAEGPNDNPDNEGWNVTLQNIAARIKERGGYRYTEGIALRDDAPSAVREQAIEYLRSRVRAADEAGTRVLVVPLLLAPGGIEHKLGLELRGLNYAFNTKTILPDSRISEWIRSQVP